MTTQVRSRIGFWSIVLLGVNGIIGSGIFLLPGKAMALMGPGSIFVYIFMAFLVMALTLCFAECAGRFTRNGAAYLYAREAFGVRRVRGGHHELGDPDHCLGGHAGRLCHPLERRLATGPGRPFRTIIILVLFLGLTTLNLLGVKPVDVLDVLVTFWKVVPLLVFIAIGVFFISAEIHPHVPWGSTATRWLGGLGDLLRLHRLRGPGGGRRGHGDPRRTLPWA